MVQSCKYGVIKLIVCRKIPKEFPGLRGKHAQTGESNNHKKVTIHHIMANLKAGRPIREFAGIRNQDWSPVNGSTW
jgi:outer membrane receptor for Fe3+-dicitrate